MSSVPSEHLRRHIDQSLATAGLRASPPPSPGLSHRGRPTHSYGVSPRALSARSRPSSVAGRAGGPTGGRPASTGMKLASGGRLVASTASSGAGGGEPRYLQPSRRERLVRMERAAQEAGTAAPPPKLPPVKLHSMYVQQSTIDWLLKF